MVRWEPGAQQRLHAAALDLYASRGFDQTTAADIAQSVGLTERTFFRYFADKREVLFAGQEHFQQVFVDGVAAAPESTPPLEAVAYALQAAASFFPDDRRTHSRQRNAIITANPGLHERELLKMSGLADAIAEALRRRGVGDPQATLAAETGVTVFGVAFRQWLAEGEERSLGEIETATLVDLQALSRSAG
jgi:AcrR family transcriptional regulator